MKILTLFIVLIALTGCDVNTENAEYGNDSDSIGKAKAICLDGIQYWTNGGQLAIRIDPKTLAPKECAK